MKKRTQNIFNWLFALIFIIIGVLNIVLVHPVPGIFYLLVSLIYLPPLDVYISKKVKIPFWVKVIIFFLIMWPTLGIGGLMEIFESWLCDCESLP